jgi:glycosyltransferase involved in cell wall biosynthesis
LRVLLLNDSAHVHTGGMNRMVVDTARLLRRLGHDVHLGVHLDGPAAVDAEIHRLPYALPRPALERELEALLARLRPDVVQNHPRWRPALLRVAVARAPTCQFLHDQTWWCSGGDRTTRDFSPCRRPHGAACLFWHYAQGCGGRNPLGNLRLWRTVRTLRGTLAALPAVRLQVASNFMRRGLLENGLPDARIDLVPLFAEEPLTTAAPEPGLLVVASRLVRAKGVHILLAALALLDDLPWRLVVAGAGPELAALRTQAAAAGLGARVEFPGEVSPEVVDGWYARAAAVVSPVLRHEPFGLVGPEAMASGRPIVAFTGGATDEWLADGETGLLVRERTPAALAAALRRLLTEPGLAARLGAGARARHAFYAPDAFGARLVAAFERTRAWHAAAR